MAGFPVQAGSWIAPPRAIWLSLHFITKILCRVGSKVTSNGHFDPGHVPRVVFRWTRPLRAGEVLGLNLAPDGKYVFASDYDTLLQMYKHLREYLEVKP